MNAEPGAVVAGWLANFERAVSAPGRSLPALFRGDSHWRDVLALTWNIQTVSGAEKIGDALGRHLAHAKPSGFTVDSLRTPPRHVTRAGTKAIEAIFRFETGPFGSRSDESDTSMAQYASCRWAGALSPAPTLTRSTRTMSFSNSMV